MAGKGLSLLVALLLLTGNLAMPVVCIASTHTDVEMPFAGCCAHFSAPARHAGVSLESSARSCGDCTDVPLISAAAPQSTREAAVAQSSCIVTDTPSAAFSGAREPRVASASLARPQTADPPVSLRC